MVKSLKGASGFMYGKYSTAKKSTYMSDGMADSLGETQQLTLTEFFQMFATSLTLVERITKARVGDKTMMDAFVPAVISLRDSAQKEKDFLDSLKTAAEAARNGAEATKDLVVRFGRAKNLGEKLSDTLIPVLFQWL
jgi:dihydroxyacetone kinase-like protein